MTTLDIMRDQINELIDKNLMVIMKKYELSSCFAYHMDMTAPVFPARLRAIMNRWAIIFQNNAKVKAKMRYVINEVVSREVDTKVVELLIEIYERQNRIPDTIDLNYALKRTHTILWYSNWNMNDKLLAEAESLMMRDGYTLLESDFVPIIERTVYSQTFVEPYAEASTNTKAVQVLPNNFNHHKNWFCGVCFDVNTYVPTWLKLCAIKYFIKRV